MPKDKKVELLEVQVNKQNVPVKEFVQDFIGLAILGMLKSLKDVPDPKEINIHIRIKPE